MRILFLGGGDWAAACVRRLIADGHAVVAVVPASSRSDEFRATTASLGLPLLEPANANHPEFVAAAAALAPDLIVSVDYDRRLRRPLLDLPPRGAINAHPGLLPAYRGVGVVTWALQNGESVVGVTVHHMDEGFDSGDVILQRTIPVAPCDRNQEVVARIGGVLPGLLSEAVRLIAAGRAPRIPQDPARATYFPARHPSENWIHWADTSRAVHDLVRALSPPGPGAVTWLNGSQVRIWRTSPRLGAPAYRCTPGQVVGHDARGPIVKTGDTSLVVEEAQEDGQVTPDRPPRWPLGTRLGVDPVELALRLQERIEWLAARFCGPGEDSAEGPGGLRRATSLQPPASKRSSSG